MKIQTKTNDSLTNCENYEIDAQNVGKFKKTKTDSTKYVLTSPMNKTTPKNLEKIDLNIREKELVGIQLKQNLKNRFRRSYKLI